jgi:hypothetical protein
MLQHSFPRFQALPLRIRLHSQQPAFVPASVTIAPRASPASPLRSSGPPPPRRSLGPVCHRAVPLPQALRRRARPCPSAFASGRHTPRHDAAAPTPILLRRAPKPLCRALPSAPSRCAIALLRTSSGEEMKMDLFPNLRYGHPNTNWYLPIVEFHLAISIYI